MFVKLVATVLAVFLAVESDAFVGKLVDADINKPDVQDALQFAVALYNAQSNSEYTSKVVKVIKAQTQVVAGMKYIFTVEMAQTTCEKADTGCAVSSNTDVAQAHQCKLAVLTQPWMNTMDLTDNTC